MDILREMEMLQYLLHQIAAVETYTGNYDEELFLRDNRTKDACLMRLLVLGEYSARIDE